MKRKISRPHIDMVIEESTNVLLPKRKNKQTTMDEDFNDVMSDVRGYEPNLFVPEDESDGAYEESTTQSFLTSQTNASNADRKRGRRHQPIDDDDLEDNDDDDDDDDEDDEDQPRFGFSR